MSQSHRHHPTPSKPEGIGRLDLSNTTASPSSNPTVTPRLFELLQHLPASSNSSTSLPREPVEFSSKEEYALIKYLTTEIRKMPSPPHFEPLLRQTYLTLTSDFDVQLTGLCRLEDFELSLRHNNIDLFQPLIRLAAAMFVQSVGPGAANHTQPPLIHYEKLLSFLGAAARHAGQPSLQELQHRNDRMEELSRPVDYGGAFSGASQQNASSGSASSSAAAVHYLPASHTDSNTARDAVLMDQLVEQFARAGIGLERLRAALQEADKYHAGTLMASQLRYVCNQQNFQPSDDTFLRWLGKLHYTGNGQYDWNEFVDVLGRMCEERSWYWSKSSTGGDGNTQRNLMTWPTDARGAAGQHQDVKSDVNGVDSNYATDSNLLPILSSRYFTTNSTYGLYQQLASSPRSRKGIQQRNQAASVGASRGPRVSGVPGGSGSGSSDNSNAPPGGASDATAAITKDATWFERFMSLADALYRNDEEFRGALPYALVDSITKHFNDKLNLDYSQIDIDTALKSSTNHFTGLVDINSLMKRLAIK